jgi:hypothetical protein
VPAPVPAPSCPLRLTWQLAAYGLRSAVFSFLPPWVGPLGPCPYLYLVAIHGL